MPAVPLIGLSIQHTRSDLLRAVLEGVAYNLRIILDVLIAQGASISTVRVIGGAAQGRLWNRILADVYNLPIYRLKLAEEATSMGAAFAGGIAVGLNSGWEMALQKNSVAETFEPDNSHSESYKRRIRMFDQAYMALEPISAQLADLAAGHYAR